MSDLPPGFQFFPTDEELVVHFLLRKVSCHPDIIPVLDLCLSDPWELNGKALRGGNYHWYFFSHAAASNKASPSPSGYWMPVGVKETVASGDRAVGIKSTLVFYVGKAPAGVKTNWVMHEYQLTDRGNKKRTDLNLVVCRVYEMSFFHVEEDELSCLDEVFLSVDDIEEISMPK